jgi:hypothetical protein
LTKSTFFRHFTDKREVLFGGQDLLAGLLSHDHRLPRRSAGDRRRRFTPERHDLAPQ